MSKIKPKEFNVFHHKNCGCYFCECKAVIGFNYNQSKSKSLKFIKHKKKYFEDLINEI